MKMSSLWMHSHQKGNISCQKNGEVCKNHQAFERTVLLKTINSQLRELESGTTCLHDTLLGSPCIVDGFHVSEGANCSGRIFYKGDVILRTFPCSAAKVCGAACDHEGFWLIVNMLQCRLPKTPRYSTWILQDNFAMWPLTPDICTATFWQSQGAEIIIVE